MSGFSPRSFRQATLPGRGPGRPRTTVNEPTPAARALIASRRYKQQMKKRGRVNKDYAPRSINSVQQISSFRGAERETIRQAFAQE